MKKIKKIIFLIALIIFAALFSSCENEDSAEAFLTLSERNIAFTQIGESTEIDVIMRDGTKEDVKWYSSNPKVAVCEDGVITAKGWGICLIRATDKNKNSASCLVTVDDLNPEINLSITDYEFSSIGETVPIKAYNSKNYDISEILLWSSSNISVATVKDGVIRSVGYGTCLVTATAKNGNTSMCIVSTVDPTIPSVEFEEIGKDDVIALDAVGDEIQLTADIFLDASDKVTWISSNTDVITCEGGLLRAVSKGTAVVIAATESGATAARMVTVEGGEDFVMPEIAENILKMDVNNIGKTIKYIDMKSDQLIASFIITGIRLECEIYDKTGDLYVIPYFTCVKVYDKNGLEGTTTFDAQMKLYKENNEFCEQYRCRFNGAKVGDTLEGETSLFGVADKGAPRPFYFVIVPVIES